MERISGPRDMMGDQGVSQGAPYHHSVAGSWAAPKMWLNVTESGSGFTVHARLPGFRDEDIQVMVDGNVVTIRAETPIGDPKEAGLQAPNRMRGILARSIALPARVESYAQRSCCVDGNVDFTFRKAGEPTAGLPIPETRSLAYS